MRRTKAIAISREGINHVRSIVERCNSAFQEISQHNDLGNDAYVEFIHDEQATSFCVALQVKTGKSFLRRNSALIIADREHFEYWRNHILPIAGIVHDPERGLSYWTNITQFLREPWRTDVARVGRGLSAQVERLAVRAGRAEVAAARRFRT